MVLIIVTLSEIWVCGGGVEVEWNWRFPWPIKLLPETGNIVLFDFFVLALLFLFNTSLTVRIYSGLILACCIYLACTHIRGPILRYGADFYCSGWWCGLLYIISYCVIMMLIRKAFCFLDRYGNANVWKTFTDLFDYFPLTALVS